MSSSEDDVLERTAFFGDRVSKRSAPTPPRLIVVDGAARGRAFDLVAESVVAGRKEDCELVLPSPAVSKRHARFLRRDGGYTIEDLRSTNGVRLNGRLLEPGDVAPLCHGDLVELSDHRLLFLNERAAVDAAAFNDAIDRDKVSAEVDVLLAMLKG